MDIKKINLLKLLSIILFGFILIVIIIIFSYKNSTNSSGPSTSPSTGIPNSPGPSTGIPNSPGPSPGIPISKCVGEWKDTNICDISLNKLIQKYGEGQLCEDQATRTGQTDCPETATSRIMDCKPKWIDSDQCKDGYLLQTYTEIPAGGWGKKCPPPPSSNIRSGTTPCTDDINRGNEPNDCVGDWTSTNICHNSNYFLKKYTISQNEKNGGKKCPHVDGEIDIQYPGPICKYGGSGYWRDIKGDCDETGRVPQQFILTKAASDENVDYLKYRIGETKCNKIDGSVPVDCKGKWEPIQDTCDYVNVSHMNQFIITNTPKNGGKKCPSESIMSGTQYTGCG